MDYRIYVADLAAYKEGKLIGEWVDIEGLDKDAILDHINSLLEGWSKAQGVKREEYAVHDYDCPADMPSFGEYPDFDALAEWVRLHAQYGDAWAVFYLNDPTGANEESFQDAYQGAYDSLEDWAEQYLDDTGALKEVPESLRCYIDFESWARDARLGGDIWSARGDDGKEHVFHNI